MMNITPSEVLTLAKKYIGYKEKASNEDLYSFEGNAGAGNYTMFQAELDRAGFWNNAKQGYEWCTSFVAWVFWRLCGSEAKQILCLIGDYGASCTAWAGYYKAAGRLFSTPKVGDQYFQKSSDGTPGHTGIVTKVEGGKFYTIEGNCGNAVKERSYALNSKSIYGFGRPYYSTQEETNMKRYTTLNEIPAGYRAEAQELMELGFNGYGDERGLGVTEDMLRCMIVNLRMCKALIKAVPSIDKAALFDEFKRNLKLSIEVE